jgi:hypothetical protein
MWDFVKKVDEEERDKRVDILEELYSMMLPKRGGVVVGMERVMSEGRPGGSNRGKCLMLQWQEGSKDYFWVGGEGRYPYLRDDVLRRLGMRGPKAMHALVCEWLHGMPKAKEKVVVMHTCRMGGLKREREGSNPRRLKSSLWFPRHQFLEE